MGTVTMYTCSSNEKYRRIASKDNRVSKKIQEVKKKNSLNNFLSSAAKIKSSYSGLPVWITYLFMIILIILSSILINHINKSTVSYLL